MLKAVNVKKIYGKGHTALTVLNGINFEYAGGEVVGIYGSSGSGKSTLLHIIGGLDRPTEGQVFFDGEQIYEYSDRRLSRYRNTTIGFVFQFYHLLPEFTAEENVMMPCLIAGLSKREAVDRSREALNKTGLFPRRKHRPSALSGGEQQRVAISRAIVMKPRLLLADEPTGNLDRETGMEVMKVLLELNSNDKMGVIMVTHDHSLVTNMDKKLEIRDGILV